MSVFMDARKQIVSVFGFSESERRALKSMFKLAGTVRDLAYGLVNPEEKITADIALVDADDPQAVRAWRREHESHVSRTPAVMVTKTLAVDDGQHVCISRPLTMKKVLGALGEANNHVKIQGGQGYAGATAGRGRYAALVVDDSLAVRRFMEDRLGTLGVPVDLHFAASGEQALALAQERHYDIIFLDIMLPGIDGYRVCKSLKVARGTRDSPVIMLTSKKSPFDRVKGSMAGCDAYLIKPPDNRRLDAIIRKYILKN